MNYQKVPHATVNALMLWVRHQGQHVVSLHTWPHFIRWSELPEWSAHIEVQGTHLFHVRIKRNGYKFAIVHEPDGAFCPTCDTHRGAPRGSHNAEDRTTWDWHSKNGAVLQPHEQWSVTV